MPDKKPDPEPRLAADLSGQLAPGVVRLFDANKVLLGYAFTEVTETGQMQRWLLYRHPGNRFSVVSDADKADWTLSTWQENVSKTIGSGGLWKSDSFYVWAQADLYIYGRTYSGVVWSKIPNPPPGASFPTEKRAQPSPYQLDDGTGKISQGVLIGFVFSVRGVTDPSNAEYWLLPSGYMAAGSAKGTPTTIAPNANFGVGLSGFVSAMNKSLWRKGSSFSITGNTNYRGVDPPAQP